MNRKLLLSLAALVLAMAGCDETYSDAVRYTVRTDPVPVKHLENEYPFPDQPGQFPILSIENFRDERNPYHAINEKTNLINDKAFVDPTKLSDADRQQIRETLDKFFGTPAKPKVGGIDEERVRKKAPLLSKLNKTSIEVLKLDEATLAEGSKHYRVHCLHCHGVMGDGRGPTARWVNPHPRDYRQGRFKFESVDQTEGPRPPSRGDLMRTLEVGIEGTAMPSFVLLPHEEREALISYVIHLSLRGNAEFTLFQKKVVFKDEKDKGGALKFDFDEDETLESLITNYQVMNVSQWVNSQDPERFIHPEPYPESYKDETGPEFKASVMRGKELFTSPRPEWAKKIGKDVCITCHKDFGRQSNFRFDDWGTFAKPNNLLMGVYRGGRRPVDIYYRAHSGIPPSTMNSFAKVVPEGTKDGYPENASALWDLVNFVRVLGNPNMRKTMGIYVD